MAVLHADQSNFDQTIAQGRVLVDFYADWCGPCLRLAPVLEQLAEELTDLTIVKVNVDNDRPVAKRFDVMSIPTLILFNNGEIVGQTMGYQTKEQLKAWLNGILEA